MAGRKIDKTAITKKIEEIEKKTSAEIVPAILGSSDVYNAAHYRMACLFCMVTSLITSSVFIDYTSLSIILSFFVFYFISKTFGPFQIFISKEEIYSETIQMSYEIFLENKIHLTKKRSGVLVFYSLLEKRIIILCDQLIKEKVENEVWKKIIEKNTDLIKTKSINESFIQTLEDVANVLSVTFPYKPKELEDVLTNELITDIE